MAQRHIRPIFVVALALCPSSAAAQYRGDCSSICAQVQSFAGQSRGDYAFIMELQRLSNACQACQMQSRWGPSPEAAPPQVNPPRFDSAPPPQRSTIGKLSKILSDIGSLWQGPKITGAQTLSSDVQQRNMQVGPSADAVEKMLTDPWRKPAVATQPSQRSFDGTNLIGSQSLQQQPVRPTAPTLDSSQTQPKGCSITAYEFNCVSTFPTVK
jgi:hypothetical protein